MTSSLHLPRRRRGLNRRQALAALGAACALAPGAADATPEAARKLLGDLVKVAPKAGKVKIDVPEIAENGNAVPVTVTVDSPMSPTDYVRAIHIIADRNPQPGVASFMLGPDNGKAEVQLRMRMAESQNVIVVAELSDGTAWTATREVKVTVGGCST
ncbi:MAG: thiosulfate oxidation carrier protein SoxY [Alphaproteobacteria bacterium]|nr:thiosulfate oxidation carrier protein SoxY [Alphaproteobacteria bacterium]